MLDNYSKSVIIEANSMVDMAKKQIVPAIEKYSRVLSEAALAKKQIDDALVSCYEKKTLSKLSVLVDQTSMKTEELESEVAKVNAIDGIIEKGYAIRDNVLSKMNELRVSCDEAEMTVGEEYWPFPTYSDLLFSVC